MLAKECFESRLAKHKEAHTLMVANLHALEGAMQEITFWIAELENAEEETSAVIDEETSA